MRSGSSLRELNSILEVLQVTVSPSAIPAYASDCSGSVRYSSACSSIGVTHMTTTVAIPLTTITITTVATSASPSATGPGYQPLLLTTYAGCLLDPASAGTFVSVEIIGPGIRTVY